MEKAIGFVLKSLKYGDSSLICHVYTRESGMMSLLIKGFFVKGKKNLRSLNFPFHQLEFHYKPGNKSSLIIPRSLQAVNSFHQMYQHPVKMLMLQFLAEILFTVLKEDDANYNLFDFIETHFVKFDKKEMHFGEFHLIFLAQLTRFLGFYPNSENQQFPYFDLSEGKFTQEKTAEYRLNEEMTILWKKLFNSVFSQEYQNHFTQSQRQELLMTLLNYYELHLPGFREPKSLEILKELMF